VKRYFGNWAEGGSSEMARDFGITEAGLPPESDILFAGYWYGSYDGSARVLYRKDGKLYEFSGGHCSCSGLERQWEDHHGEVTPESLAMRPGLDEYSADNESREAWLQLVAKLNGRRR
jgi:hypothetical protein